MQRNGLLTEGVIWKQILIFSIPLIIGNFFQQMYNTVDTLVIGNYLGGIALASVGAGNVIINLLLSLFAGLATGAGVLIAQLFGAHVWGRVRLAVRTTAAFTLLAGLVMTVVGVVGSGPALSLIGTPPEVMPGARLYLWIYFSGILPLMIYNVGAGILRAVGDSRTPLYYLVAATVVNVVLDLLFVAVFGMGVGGVAVATLIAQTLAAALIVLKLTRTQAVYRVDLRRLRIVPAVLRAILRIGVPAGMQQMAMSVSNLVVQSCINALGPTVMAAWNVYNKLDGVAVLPILSFGLAMTTFTGQNVGAGLRERVYEGTRVGALMSCAFAVAFSILLAICGPQLFSLFTKEPEILAYGTRMIRGLSPFYFLVAIMYVLSGVINGAGYSLPTMVIMLTNLCVVRIVFLKTMPVFLPGVELVLWAFVVSWTTCVGGLWLYYRKGTWRRALPPETDRKPDEKL